MRTMTAAPLVRGRATSDLVLLSYCSRWQIPPPLANVELSHTLVMARGERVCSVSYAEKVIVCGRSLATCTTLRAFGLASGLVWVGLMQKPARCGA